MSTTFAGVGGSEAGIFPRIGATMKDTELERLHEELESARGGQNTGEDCAAGAIPARSNNY